MAQRNQNIFVAATAAFQKKFSKFRSTDVGTGVLAGFDISRPAGWIEYWDDQSGVAQPVISVDATTGITHFANTNGNIFDTAVTLAGGLADSATDAQTAFGGGGQTSATLMPSVVNRITTVVAAGDSVKLPPAVAGLSIILINSATSGFTMQVFGSGTDTINDVATATGVSQPVNDTAVYWCAKGGAAGKWYSGVVNAYSAVTDVNGNPGLTFTATTTAVNGLTETNSATGDGTNNAVVLAASGADTAVRFDLRPKGVAGQMVLGLATGTGDIVVGSSSGTQTTRIGNGAGIVNTNIAMVTIAGSTTAIAGAATGSGLVDEIDIGLGNAVATAKKIVKIATGTPGTSGNNQVTVGGGATSVVGVNAVARTYQAWNYIATESGANNALVAALTDAAGSNVTVAAGLSVAIKLAHTLQAGANSFNLNGHGTDAIKKASAPASDVAVVAASGSIIHLVFDGTVWQVVGQ